MKPPGREASGSVARSLRAPPAVEARDRGLDLLNMLLAGSGSVYGAFIPVYLAGHAWTQTHIGLVLTVGTTASMLCQVPAGLIVDAAGPGRRRILAAAIVTTSVAPLLFAALPRSLPVLLAILLQAAAASLLSPAVAATSLAVSGRAGFSERLGRNARYGSIGAGGGAVVMGACVYLGAGRAIFLIAAALVLPTLWALRAIGPDREQPVASVAKDPHGLLAPLVLLRDRRLLVFALCIALFQLASIAVLQLAAVEVTGQLGSYSGIVIAAFLLIPQIVVAWLSPAIGRIAETHGRRAVLLLGFVTVPLRGVLFTLVPNPYARMPVQVLEGLGGSVFGVMMPLVAADLTRETGRYTLCLSLLGLVAGLGAAISAALAGWVTDHFGRIAAFWVLTGAGVAAVALVALGMPETRPQPAGQSAEPKRLG